MAYRSKLMRLIALLAFAFLLTQSYAQEAAGGLAGDLAEGEEDKSVKEINDEGITVLLVEQNAGLAFEHTQYVYVLEVGRVVLEGSAKEIMSNETVQRAFLG